MKKLIYLLVICALMLSAAACGSREEAEQETTTLMVYMIGSDLESKNGAGTEDLQEMAQSGVDLSKVNVLVYAGGTPTWHNDLTVPEQHALLMLTQQGFETITTTQSYSMGLAECMSSFLTYGYENFPADNYGLILWDHGNGPVIGYGKDMLFDNDCLTLKEMEQAMENSPFKEENKLAWVGFDACLMASVELAAVWAPYADYLVASQEVEPAFGWNYSFLSRISVCNTEKLLTSLATSYLEDCLAYYKERGYEDRDTTLSCLDLSKVSALETAVNALFAKADGDIALEYNQLTARRANTRALGRASTGSEYDLVDLQDMAMWLGELYPQEAEALICAIEDAVVANETNARSLCGISLYYPFHNKYYYEKDWAAAYEELGVFPAYQQYLEDYEQIWLENDKLDSASSETPEEDDGVYTLQLTPEQNENLASAKYYILIRDGEEYFTRLFTSSDVENRDGLLTAGFDGNVLYVADEYGNYHIPVSWEMDRVGETGRYIVPVTLTNCCLDISQPEDFEMDFQSHRYNLNIHKDTGAVTVSALVPYDNQTDSELTGGKKEDSELTGWTNAYFFHDSHRYLSRYENGAVLPVDQWPEDTVITGVSYALENELDFTYAPLVEGDYYLLFEMEDTQGNRYCSELLPIHTDGKLPQPEQKEQAVTVSWTSGSSVLLTEQDGVQIWLEKVTSFGTEGYALKAQNNNEYPVIVVGSDLYLDQQLLCRESFGFLEVPAGESAISDVGMDLGAVSKLGLEVDTGKLRFALTLRHGVTYGAKFFEKPVEITLAKEMQLHTDETVRTYNSFSLPAYGCRATDQLLYESSSLRVRLLGIGSNGIDKSIRGCLLVENLADRSIELELEGIRLDDMYVPMYMSRLTVPAGDSSYALFSIEAYNLTYTGIESVAAMKLLLRIYEYNPLFSGNSKSEMAWCDVELEEAGQACTAPAGQVLYEQDGIRISLVHFQTEFEYRQLWYLAVTNTTDRDISLDILDCMAGREAVESYTSVTDSGVPAGTTAICRISYSNYVSKLPADSISFLLRFMDFKKEAILYTAETRTVLMAQQEETEN